MLAVELVRYHNLTSDTSCISKRKKNSWRLSFSGGSAFHMARLYSAKVHGIDLSKNMVSIATEYQRGMEESVRENVSFESLPIYSLEIRKYFSFPKVSFEVSDITEQKFEPGSFDVIYSRDSILHIEDKKELFSNFFVRPEDF